MLLNMFCTLLSCALQAVVRVCASDCCESEVLLELVAPVKKADVAKALDCAAAFKMAAADCSIVQVTDPMLWLPQVNVTSLQVELPAKLHVTS